MALVKITRPGFAPGASLADGSAAATPAREGPVTIAASSDVSEAPRARFVVGSAVFVVVAAILAYLFDREGRLRDPLKLAGDVNAFALIYVATQGIERLLEPLSYFLHPVDDNKEAARKKREEVSLPDNPADALTAAKEAANQAAVVNRKQGERSILFWVLASLAGILVSAAFGLHFLGIILDDASRAAIPRWFDVVATGLAIGGGTKALHGLVEKIGKPKTDEAET